MPMAGSFASRSDYEKKPPKKSQKHVLCNSLKPPQKFRSAQEVPMNVPAIQAALTAANS